MQPWEKAALLTELSKSVHRLSLAGLSARFPEETHEELEHRAACLRLGAQLAETVSRQTSGS